MYHNQKNNFFHGITFHHFHDGLTHRKSQGSIDKDTFYKIINFIEKKNILDADVFFEKFTGRNIIGNISPDGSRIVSFFKDELIVGGLIFCFGYSSSTYFINDSKNKSISPILLCPFWRNLKLKVSFLFILQCLKKNQMI